eukprot:Lithocolla_globosa_v1_NODE_2878_length_1838_cov_4.805384.p1 type:complete len:511 gc:universal NODE_2878_length_1838_cov_4.805384:279-1811(+)
MVTPADVILVIFSCVLFLMLIAASIYFVVYFQHPDDKNVAWFPKVVVILGLVVASTNVLLVPLDIGTQNGEINATGLFPMQQLNLSFFLITVILFFAVIPFTYIYYESYDEDERKQSVVGQLISATLWVVPLLLVLGIIIVIFYWFFGYAEIPLAVLSSELTFPNPDDNYCFPASQVPGEPETAPCRSITEFTRVRVSPVVYIIAIVNLLGWVVLIAFGGVGMIALPVDLILGYIHRPRPMKLAEYTREKSLMSTRASLLLTEGQDIKERKENIQSLKNSNQKKDKKNVKRTEQDLKKFKQSVLLMERDFFDLNEAYKNQGGNILIHWFKLFCGVLSTILTTLWLFHILLYNLPLALGADKPVTPFLNSVFIACSKAPLFGPLLYGLFAFYILICVIKGNVKLGFRFVFFTLYPMELHNTMMSSLLFNTGLILCGSLAVVQLCVVSFVEYARFTAIVEIFSVQINNLVGIKYVFTFYLFGLLGFIALTGIYLIFKPYDRPIGKYENPQRI